MKGPSVLAIVGLLAAACAGSSSPPSTTTSIPSTTTTVTATTSTSAVATTTTTTVSLDPVFAGDLPDGSCSIDEPPADGEPTVLVGDRLYGLGADLSEPRCLVEGVTSEDIEWGPLGDRIRIGLSISGATIESQTFDTASSLEWTAPTGSRIVVVSPDSVVKVSVDGGEDQFITFLDTTDEVAYHPAGTHLLAVGTDTLGQYGMWFASNDGVNFVLLAFDEDAEISEPSWSWLNEPLFVAAHGDGHWHVHRVELVDGAFQGPIVVESTSSIDRLLPSPRDPVMLGYRSAGEAGLACVEGATAAVNGVDLPEPLAGFTSTPVGWLSNERLLILAYPEGCDGQADLWWFSAGFCPGSTYGATLLMNGVDGAAARQPMPMAPPPPDFTGVIDPAPA